MKKKEIAFLVVFVVSNLASAADKLFEYQELEKENLQNPMKLVEVLLRPYGKISDFKITDESVSSEVCVDQTSIKAKISCHKKEKNKTQLYLAEGKGLLCKVHDNFTKINCVLTEK